MKRKLWYVILMSLLLSLTSCSLQELKYKRYVAEGPSMEPTLSKDDKFSVDPDYYKTHSFQRGDLIVYHAPAGIMYVKRVIALEGEKIRLADNKVYLNGEPLEEPYIAKAVAARELSGSKYNMDFPETKVYEGTVFVLGDNRPNSNDSRISGAVSTDQVIGKVMKIQHVAEK